MSDPLEKLQNAAGLVAKIAAIVFGFGGTGSTVWNGGDRVFKGFAGRHGLVNFRASVFSEDVLKSWGMEIVEEPVKGILKSPISGFFFVVAFLGLFYVLMIHLLSRPARDETASWYRRNHHWVTLLIYLVLALLILVPTHTTLFFLALILFVLFATAHLYLRSSDLKEGTKEQKALYGICLALLIVVVILLPTAYGMNYFSPDVWCIEADVVESVLWSKPQESTKIFFSDPVQGGELVIGMLLAPQGSLDEPERELRLVRQGEAARYKAKDASRAVDLASLLEFEVKWIEVDQQPVDLAAEKAKLQAALAGQAPMRTDRGYGSPRPVPPPGGGPADG